MEETRKEKIVERLRAISPDEEWIRQVLNVPSAEEANQLLQEKNVSVSELQRDMIIIRRASEDLELSEEELTAVTGGGLLGDCPQSYNWFICDFSMCKNSVTTWFNNDYSTKKNYCKLGYWHE